jgi:hypothetical protein
MEPWVMFDGLSRDKASDDVEPKARPETLICPKQFQRFRQHYKTEFSCDCGLIQTVEYTSLSLDSLYHTCEQCGKYYKKSCRIREDQIASTVITQICTHCQHTDEGVACCHCAEKQA